jgi:hypothetical protein
MAAQPLGAAYYVVAQACAQVRSPRELHIPLQPAFAPLPCTQVYPATWKTLNYAPFTVAAVVLLAGGFWFYARSYFKGHVGDQGTKDSEQEAGEVVAGQTVKDVTAGDVQPAAGEDVRTVKDVTAG